MVDRILEQLSELKEEVEAVPETAYREGYLDAIDFITSLIAESYD
jgi:hypothetical protein